MKKFNLFKKCILYVAFIISFLNADARGPRADLNSLTDAQRLELCGLVDNWLTTYLIAFHGDDFDNFHTTNDYLRWHRDHFIDLERFILEQDPSGIKGYDRYVPFPKWDPSKVIPSYFNGFDASGGNYNNISSKCTRTGCVTREDYVNTNPGYKFNQSGSFNENLPLPARFSGSGTLCSFTGGWPFTSRNFDFSDVADYSDNQQYTYHNFGHLAFDINSTNFSIMGTGFGNNRAAGAFIFWAWHAWIDDLWWSWDACHKQNTNAYDLATGITIPSGSTVSWNTSGNIKKIQGKVIVEPGAILVIENGQIVEMLDDYYTDQPCGFEVRAGTGGQIGGILLIRSGAILRGITSLGINRTVGGGTTKSRDKNTNLDIYPDSKVYYLSQWPGIVVKGDASKDALSTIQGLVMIDGSSGNVIIQNAKTGITSENGGRITCTKGIFRNCSTAVELKPYLSPSNNEVSGSNFVETTFEVNDHITRYFTNDNMYMHYNHDFHDVILVKMTRVRGVDFAGCKFLNNDLNIYTVGHNNTRGTGIKSIESSYALHNNGIGTMNPLTECPEFSGLIQCEFQNLSFGIDATVASGTSVRNEIGVQQTIFNNIHDAVSANAIDNLKIFRSTFSYDIATAKFPPGVAGSHMHFINTSDNHQNIIFDNTLTSNEPVGTFISLFCTSITHEFSKVQKNNFFGTSIAPLDVIGVEVNGNNLKTDIKCNVFNQRFNACILNGGVLKTQGSPTLSAGNLFMTDLYPACTIDPEQHLKNDFGASVFTYFFKSLIPFEEPICSTSTIITNDVGLGISPNDGDQESAKLCDLNCIGRGLNVRTPEQKSMFKIYPNPANTKFTLEVLSRIGTIKLYDAIGKLVWTQAVESTFTDVDVSQYHRGIYQVVLEQKGIINTTQKLIVK
jgi:hypothetical protein